ncbi:MAG: hypothetical protein CHACPFDD_00635 [Phycisphaerae bacterium]|nr:hypothetical protein [Phycisphaerae bacterium]
MSTGVWLAALLSVACAGRDGQQTGVPAASSQPATTSAPLRPRVELSIGRQGEDWGRVVLELDAKRAPQTVANFLAYVDAGFYDGTIFHRVLSRTMVVGGSFGPDDALKTEGLRPPVRNEWPNGLKHARGTVAMSRKNGEADSATSEFFVNLADNAHLDEAGPDGAGFCVFGLVAEGLDVIERAQSVKMGPNETYRDRRSKPVEPIVIRRARRLAPASQPALRTP